MVSLLWVGKTWIFHKLHIKLTRFKYHFCNGKNRPNVFYFLHGCEVCLHCRTKSIFLIELARFNHLAFNEFFTSSISRYFALCVILSVMSFLTTTSGHIDNISIVFTYSANSSAFVHLHQDKP